MVWRRWTRFSLRSLLLASLLVGAGWMVYGVWPAWRLQYVMDITEANRDGERFKIGNTLFCERYGKHFTLYRNDSPIFDFEFHETVQEGGGMRLSNNNIARVCSPDLSKLFLADQAHAALFDLPARKKLFEWRLIESSSPTLSFSSIQNVAYSHDGTQIAVVPQHSRILILNAQTGAIDAVCQFECVWVRHIQFSPDAKALLLNFNDKLVLFDIPSNKAIFTRTTLKDTSYQVCQWLFSTPNTIVGYTPKSGVEWIDAKTGKTTKSVWRDPQYSFEGFAEDGEKFIVSQPPSSAIRVKNPLHMARVRSSRDGALLYTLPINENGRECIPKISCLGDLCAVSDDDASTILYKIGNEHAVDYLQPYELSSLKPLKKSLEIMDVTCRFVPQARHCIGSTKSSSDGDAFMVEMENMEGITRCFFMRRNHREEWWGIATTAKFWLAAVLAVGFLWSVIQDWRGLPRKRRAVPTTV